jgi:hypothetical protein
MFPKVSQLPEPSYKLAQSKVQLVQHHNNKEYFIFNQ